MTVSSPAEHTQTLAAALPSWPGGWQLLRACQAPERHARSVLRDLLGRNAGSAFCRAHELDATTSLAAYRQRVPIRNYQALSPWIERSCGGDSAVLTRDAVRRITRTSGTTAAPKSLPLTRGLERAFAAAQQLWISAVMEQTAATRQGVIYVLATAGQPTALSSSPGHDVTDGGISLGSSTALGLVRPSALQGRLHLPPPSLSQVADYDLRLYLTLLDALSRDLSMLVAVSPSTLVLLFERLGQWGEALVSDLQHGTVHWRDSPLPAELLATHTPQPERAARLRRLIRQHGALRPRQAWPALALLSCWTAGPSARYRPYLDNLSEGLPVHDPGYAASEGWFAPALMCGSPAALPLASHYLFELLEPEASSDDPTVPFAELALGRRYRLVVSTPAGLYRYDTEDLVEVRGRLGKTPLICFCQRAGAVVSVAGEKLTETQLVEAMCRAEKRLGIVVRDFVAEAVFDALPPPYYRLCAALTEPNDDALEALAASVDEALCEVNIEYRLKRSTGRLGPARVDEVGVDAFIAERRARADEGGPDAQLKTLHLRLDVATDREQ